MISIILEPDAQFDYLARQPGTLTTMRIAEFDYELPEELIAQHPVVPRDASRLLVLHRESGADRAPALSRLAANICAKGICWC